MNDNVSDCAVLEDAKTVIELLNQQLALYSQLNQLAQTQRALITSDEPERLLAVLSERQQLIDRLESTAMKLRPYQANWHEFRKHLDADQGQTVDHLIDEVNAILSEILRRDEADGELLSARKGSTAQAMSEIRTAKQAGAAYAATGDAQKSSTDWTSA